MTLSTITITRWPNLVDTQGTEQMLSWEYLVTQLSARPRLFRGDKEHPGWSPASFKDERRLLANCRSVFALCLDYDDGETIDAAQALWSGNAGLLHTSRKHRPEAPRFRLVLPLARPVSPFEFSALWTRAAHHAGRKPDPQAKDASRFWYLPGCPAGSEFVARSWDGPWLDPDEWLRKPDPTQAAPRSNVTAPPRVGSDLESRASRYLAKIPAAVSGQGGHQQTWEAAVVLARGFKLSEEQTFRLLRDEYNQRCEPPWSEKELLHKAQHATNAHVPLGYICDQEREEREYRPRPRLPECPPDPDPDYVPEPPEGYGSDEYPDDLPVDDPTPLPEERTRLVAEPRKIPAIERYHVLSEHKLLDDFLTAMQNPAPPRGCPSGIQDLDEAIGGFRRGNFTIFGAKRSMGKTGVSILVRDATADASMGCVMFAGEDAARMYAARIMAKRSGINALTLRDLRWADEFAKQRDIAKAVHAVAGATKLPFLVPAYGMLVEDIAQAIKDLAGEISVDLVIIDYLQRLRSKRSFPKRAELVSYMAGVLSDAIKGIDAAGLLISQLKRGGEERPDLEALKETGDLEDMAEHVLLGWRRKANDRDEPDERLIIVAKNKDGRDDLPDITVPFDPITASFRSTYGYDVTRENLDQTWSAAEAAAADY